MIRNEMVNTSVSKINCFYKIFIILYLFYLQKPDPVATRYIFTENAKFCRQKGMRQVLFVDEPSTWSYDKKTVDQVQNVIELIYKNQMSYDLMPLLLYYKTFIYEAYKKFYGIH